MISVVAIFLLGWPLTAWAILSVFPLLNESSTIGRVKTSNSDIMQIALYSLAWPAILLYFTIAIISRKNMETKEKRPRAPLNRLVISSSRK